MNDPTNRLTFQAAGLWPAPATRNDQRYYKRLKQSGKWMIKTTLKLHAHTVCLNATQD
jgi:hypothetical protein